MSKQAMIVAPHRSCKRGAAAGLAGRQQALKTTFLSVQMKGEAIYE